MAAFSWIYLYWSDRHTNAESAGSAENDSQLTQPQDSPQAPQQQYEAPPEPAKKCNKYHRVKIKIGNLKSESRHDSAPLQNPRADTPRLADNTTDSTTANHH
jgi:hypothetical protein